MRIGGFVLNLRAIGVSTVLAVVVTGLAGVPAAGTAESESSYIVELAPGETPFAVSSDVVDESAITETFDSVLTGFAAELTSSEVEDLRSSPGVVAVYEDQPVSISATQADAPWNLSRLDQSTPPADNFYTYPDTAGSGTRIYVVDTGISPNASQFGSRLLPGMTAILDGRGTADCNSHGTHVAGIAASTTYGVAKLANVVPVRVFGCSGETYTSTVLTGLDWILANHPSGVPGIVNMSLVSVDPVAPGTPDPLTNAVNTMSNQGFVMVVAAGNSNADACNYTPSRAADALTVAATTSTDARASYSNFGTCVDLFAPGSSISSLQWNNPGGSSVKSGTSMAAPHVAGIVAVGWGMAPSSTASAIVTQVIGQALPNQVTSQGPGSTRLLSSLTALNGGSITYPSTTGALAILKAYFAGGGTSGPLGAPSTDLQTLSCPQGASNCLAQFAGGLIVWSSQFGAFSMNALGADYYLSSGGVAGSLGFPTSHWEPFSAGGVSGTLQYFQNGMVLSSSTTGTFAVLNGAIRNAWGTTGGSGGTLGWPTGDRMPSGTGFQQAFQRGTIYETASGTAGVLSGAIATYWTTGSNGQRLGSPTSQPGPWSAGGVSGTLQYFQNGMVLSSSTTGTFAVLNGAIRNAWGTTGGSGGTLGWPTGDRMPSGTGFQQAFQRGTIYETASGTAGVLSGAIATYWTTGSNGQRLGSPTSQPGPWSAGGVSGTLQYFQNGMVLSSSTTGTFAVLNGAIRNAWGTTGGSGGTLGWPTGDRMPSGTGFQQAFQRGTIYETASGTAGVLSGAIATYWTTGSNGQRLGSPTSQPGPWSAGGVSGTLQYFQNGMVLSSSTTGTFAVLNGAIRNAWGTTGGSGGTLGWPTGDQESRADGLMQQFQRGFVLLPSGGGTAIIGS
ncbi:MAG: S8 family serine peptidase [Microcella sp.]|uniref:S8 family serine peptidase n=1 Tax=Microcella sp. TaxID=1913979 RepID=UPI0024C9930C|nr:S8 family serine peptidase [Microcella sp.]UYN82554.1 MAG: S8 family serine peptidase [Microcella sp.]